MPISYRSTVHKPLEYTQPVDLNLLGKVLQYEQLDFDRGVQKVQSGIDSIAALDVVKGADKDYLNTKLNNLVNTINNIGGVDYSDPNIQNQISGLSSQIYGDDNIINAVGNTKKLRYVQSYYKDLKEKKPKEYNPANEWYDMGKFSSWLNDGQVGTNPTGDAGNTTPFHDYEADWEKLFSTIANSANMEVQWNDRGLMYMKDGKKYVSPDRIAATAAMMLTPQQRTQLAIEGRYTYQGVPLGDLTKAYDSKLYEQIGAANGELNDYKTKLKGATSLKDQQDYQKLVSEKEAEVTKLMAPIKNSADQMREKLYLDEKFKGLQARYSFSQATSTMQAATDKMFNLNYAMQKAKFEYQQKKDAVDQQIDMAKDGLKWDVDFYGNKTVVDDPNNPRGKGKGKNGTGKESPYANLPLMNNANAEQNVSFTQKTLDERKTGLLKANDQLFNQFIKDLGWKMGWSETFINDATDDGFIQGKYDPQAIKMATDYKNAWEASMRGEKVNFDYLDPLFKNFIGKYQENRAEIDAVDDFYKKVDNQVREKYGINPQTFDAYTKYTNAQKELQRARANGTSYQPTPVNPLDPTSKALSAEEKFNQVQAEISGGQTVPGTNFYKLPFDSKKMQDYFTNREAERTSLINQGSVRFNLPGLTISDDKENNIAKMVAANAGTMEYYNEAGEPLGKKTLNASMIEPVSVGYSYINASGNMAKQPTMTFRIKTGTKPEDFQIAKVPLSPQQATTFGFGKDIHDISGYRFALHTNGVAKNIGTTSGSSYQLQYDIKKYHPEDYNDPSVFVVVKGKAGPISLYNNPFTSVESAMQFMEGATKQASLDDAITLLDGVARGQIYNK